MPANLNPPPDALDSLKCGVSVSQRAGGILDGGENGFFRSIPVATSLQSFSFSLKEETSFSSALMKGSK